MAGTVERTSTKWSRERIFGASAARAGTAKSANRASHLHRVAGLKIAGVRFLREFLGGACAGVNLRGSA